MAKPRRAKARQTVKRATFPWINGMVIAVAESGDLQPLLQVIENLMPQMNLVNLSTSLHRLAKVVASDSDARATLRTSPLLAKLLSTTCAALGKVGPTSAVSRCQALSNTSWALATIQVPDLRLLKLMAGIASRHMDGFKPFELTTILESFAKLGALEPKARTCSVALFEAAKDYIHANTASFSVHCLVITAWAFAAAPAHDAAVFHSIAQQMVPMVHGANCQDMARAAWSFSAVGIRHDKLFCELVQFATPRLAEFKPQELSDMLWSFASMGLFHEAFFEAAAAAAQKLDLQPPHLASILWAISRLQPRHCATRAALLVLLPRCTQKLPAFKPEELTAVALAAARCFGGEEGSPSQLTTAPLAVTEFFAAALPQVLPRLRELSGPAFANIAASLLAMRASCGCDAELFPAIGREAAARARALSPAVLLLLLQSLLQAPEGSEVRDALRVLFAEAARRLDAWRPQELLALARVCASLLGHTRAALPFHEELRSECWRLAEADREAPEACPVQPSHISAAGLAPDKLVSGVSGEMVGAPASLHGWSPASAASAAEAYNIEEASTSEGETSSGPPRGRALATEGCTIVVKNTFLDIRTEDGWDMNSEGIATSDWRLPLPPPLAILPADVSAEALAAYREGYQRFRAGEAVGAKGEASAACSFSRESPF